MGVLDETGDSHGGGARRLQSRRHRRGGHAPSATRSRLRLFYFLIASLWGFLIGAAGLLGGLALMGRPIEAPSPLLLALSVAGAVAMGGGVVASRAYAEARARLR